MKSLSEKSGSILPNGGIKTSEVWNISEADL